MNSYIISAPDVSLAYDRALQMAADLTGNPRKVYSHTHPDVVTIYKDKTELSVDKVRQVVSDAAILPNESDHKVYIFYDGKDMNTAAQNAALKLLEEPPEGVVLLLLTDRASSFLPTIRSRCAEIRINAPGAESGEDDAFTGGLVQAYCSGRPLTLYRFCEQNNKMTITECKQKLLGVRERIAGILTGRESCPGADSGRLLALDALMEQCLRYLEANVNVKQVMGFLESSL